VASFACKHGIVSSVVDARDSLRVWVAVEFVGACLLLVATAAMPWASYHVQGASSTESLHADSLSLSLISVATVTLVVGALQIIWRLTALAWTAAVAGAVAVVLSVVEAARRISHANSLTLSAGGSTSYASGSALAVLGALAVSTAAVAVGLMHRPSAG
jgi:hypothetical protein